MMKSTQCARRSLSIKLAFISVMIVLFVHTQSAAQILPYPKSDIIQGIEIDWSTHQRHAQGSDNFHLTWSDDNHQYGIWGDGGGFQGTNGKYRVSFGVVRIEGGQKITRDLMYMDILKAPNTRQT